MSQALAIPPAKRAPLSPQEIDRVVDLRERGSTQAMIARLLQCSPGAVQSALLKLGVDIHADRPLAPVPLEPVVFRRGNHLVRRFDRAEDDQLLALEADGFSDYAIGIILGRRTHSVTGRLRCLARRQARAEAHALAAGQAADLST